MTSRNDRIGRMAASAACILALCGCAGDPAPTAPAPAPAKPVLRRGEVKLGDIAPVLPGPARSAPPASAPGGRPAAAVAPGTTYTVRSGDTLYRIAESVYGDRSRWKDILNANRAQLPSPSALKPGMVLVLP